MPSCKLMHQIEQENKSTQISVVLFFLIFRIDRNKNSEEMVLKTEMEQNRISQLLASILTASKTRTHTVLASPRFDVWNPELNWGQKCTLQNNVFQSTNFKSSKVGHLRPTTWVFLKDMPKDGWIIIFKIDNYITMIFQHG